MTNETPDRRDEPDDLGLRGNDELTTGEAADPAPSNTWDPADAAAGRPPAPAGATELPDEEGARTSTKGGAEPTASSSIGGHGE